MIFNNIQEFSSIRLRDYLKENDPFLLDVREPWEFEICRLKGSILIPMGQLIGNLEMIREKEELVVICHHGIRSRRVCHFLKSQGFEKLINLKDGLDGWAKDIDKEMKIY
tara:strand:+ start:23968 stop:24297 length:330 start_codon:yes stop_codon:yes gene_type:complete